MGPVSKRKGKSIDGFGPVRLAIVDHRQLGWQPELQDRRNEAIGCLFNTVGFLRRLFLSRQFFFQNRDFVLQTFNAIRLNLQRGYRHA